MRKGGKKGGVEKRRRGWKERKKEKKKKREIGQLSESSRYFVQFVRTKGRRRGEVWSVQRPTSAKGREGKWKISTPPRRYFSTQFRTITKLPPSPRRSFIQLTAFLFICTVKARWRDWPCARDKSPRKYCRTSISLAKTRSRNKIRKKKKEKGRASKSSLLEKVIVDRGGEGEKGKKRKRKRQKRGQTSERDEKRK